MQNDSFYTGLLACLDANGICCGQTGSAQQILAAAFDPTTCSLRVDTTPGPFIPVPRTSSISRTGGPNSVVTPYQDLSVTSISGDVTIDTGGGPQAIPASFSWNVGVSVQEVLANTVDIDGTDYILTVVV
jgi:hypothetical protein